LHQERKHLTIVHYLERAERIVLSLIAIVLVVLALLLLVNSVIGMGSWVWATVTNNADTLAKPEISPIGILDGVLLVMMTMEIVYTVTLSLQSHKLVAEPFLIIGIIAAIRRTLVITAESTRLESNPAAFQSTLLELGLLSFIVGVMAISIWVIRRSNKFVTDQDEEELKDE